MSCTRFRERLDALIDGTLDADERREADEHLASCADCRARLEERTRLLAGVAALPRSLQPSRDLWPGIEARIEGDKVVRGRFAGAGKSLWARPGLLAAAALALVVASSGLTALFLRGGAPATTPPAAAAEITAATVAWQQFTAAEEEYRRVTGELEQELEARRDELAPETVRTVEENLKIIDQAIREAREALERDPANAGLANKLTDIYRKKADFLRAMIRL